MVLLALACPVLAVSPAPVVLPRPVAMTARRLRRSTKREACKKEIESSLCRKSYGFDGSRIMGGKNSVLFSSVVFFFSNGFSLRSSFFFFTLLFLYVRTAFTGL